MRDRVQVRFSGGYYTEEMKVKKKVLVVGMKMKKRKRRK